MESSSEETLKYLQNVRELERSCYIQEQYIANLDDQIYENDNPEKYSYRELTAVPEPSIPFIEYAFYGVKYGGGAGAIIGFLKSFFDDLLQGVVNTVITYALIFGALGFLIGFAFYRSRRSEIESLVEQKNLKANQENDIRRQKNEQIDSTSKKRAPILEAEYKNAMDAYLETKSVLKRYYDEDIVYKKYREIVPITMFCEYFESGRCTTLTGHEGAYNIYESEARADLILVKLDDVIEELDRIEDNQYMLAHMLEQCQQDINNLSSLADEQLSYLKKIDGNQEIAAHYEQISAQNTELLKWLAIYEESRK